MCRRCGRWDSFRRPSAAASAAAALGHRRRVETRTRSRVEASAPSRRLPLAESAGGAAAPRDSRAGCKKDRGWKPGAAPVLARGAPLRSISPALEPLAAAQAAEVRSRRIGAIAAPLAEIVPAANAPHRVENQ